MGHYPGDLSRTELEHRLLRLEDRVFSGSTPEDIEYGSESEPLPPIRSEMVKISETPTEDGDVARVKDIDGKAGLTNDGKIISEQIPNLAITNTYTVADEAERLALDVQEGDIAIQNDTDTTYLFTGGDPSQTANWSTIIFNVVAEVDGATVTPHRVQVTELVADSHRVFIQDTEPTAEEVGDVWIDNSEAFQ